MIEIRCINANTHVEITIKGFCKNEKMVKIKVGEKHKQFISRAEIQRMERRMK